MLRVHADEHRLTLADPWEVAHGRSTHRHSLIVTLEELATGRRGLGEAPEVRYEHWTTQAYAAQLDAARPTLQRGFVGDPARWWPTVRQALGGEDALPPILSAIDAAAHDLWGQREGQPVHALWNDGPRRAMPSSYTLGIDTPDVTHRKLTAAGAWPVYKIKLGTGDLGRDLSVVQMLRGLTDVPLRVDANTAWSPQELMAAVPCLAELGVELIEQPMTHALHAAHPDVTRECGLPVFADESCTGPDDVARCAALGFAGINVKLTKAGGLTPAREMLHHARQLGLRTMLGCMIETSVGISAAAQLLPLLDHADLDGARLLAHDPATGTRVTPQGIHLSPQPGLAVTYAAPRSRDE